MTARVYTGVEKLRIRLTFKDQDNAAVDISAGLGTLVIKLKRPKGQSTVSYSGGSVVIQDGEAGIAYVDTAAGQITKAGVHTAQGWFTRSSDGGVFPSEPLDFTVFKSPT